MTKDQNFADIANAAAHAISALAIQTLQDDKERLRKFAQMCLYTPPPEDSGEFYGQFMRQVISTIEHTTAHDFDNFDSYDSDKG